MSVAQSAPAVLAPAVALVLDVPAERIGWFTGIVYLAAMVSGLQAGDYGARFGAVRISQVALLASASGLICLVAASGWAVLAAALLIGAGYGLSNPTAASILAAHVPVRRRGLYFSLKQTGVPIGVAGSGVLAPLLFAFWGWQGAALGLAMLCLAGALSLQPARRVFDRGAEAVRAPAAASWSSPLRTVWREPALRRLGATSFSFSCTQVCLLTFLVAYLKLEQGFTLAAAAGILAVAQAVSIAGRPFWGMVADRWQQPERLLGLLGLGMAAALLCLAAMPSQAGTLWATVASMACAATAVAWNGVFFAALAARVRPGELATVTGGVMFMTFSGGMLGPVVFGSLVGLAGSYAMVFALLAALPTVAGGFTFAGARRSAPMAAASTFDPTSR